MHTRTEGLRILESRIQDVGTSIAKIVRQDLVCKGQRLLSTSQEAFIRDLDFEFTNLPSRDIVDSAETAAAVSYNDWRGTDSALSTMTTQSESEALTTDVPIQDQLSIIFSSGRAHLRKLENERELRKRELEMRQQDKYIEAATKYCKQGEPSQRYARRT
jgi:hypothetical protein